MRAAIYARVSTDQQGRDQTIDSQLNLLQQWVQEQGHTLNSTHIYKDEGYSGARLDRPGLDALRDAVIDGTVDIIAVFSPDRLARKYAYQVVLLEEFRRSGCDVVFVQHPLSNDPSDQLLLQIQGAIAEYERALISERFRRGKLQKARGGQWLGTKAPYGYRYIPKARDLPGHLIIDEHEAEFVRMLYHWLITEAMTIRQIIMRLNAGPWLPRCGKRPWSLSVVRHILSEPIYTGVAYANRYQFVPPKKPQTSGSRRHSDNTCRQLRPRDEWIAIPMPAIVDQETYDLAQAQLKRNGLLSFRNNTKYTYLLRCLLTCKTCGLAMHGTTTTSKRSTRTHRYYECQGRDCSVSAREVVCPQRPVRGEELEAAVWEHVTTLLGDPAQLLAQFERSLQVAVEGDERERALTQKQETLLNRLAREEQRLLDAYQAEVITLDELKQRRRQVAERHQVVRVQQEQQTKLRREAVQMHQLQVDVVTFCERIRCRLDGASVEEKQAILQLVVERVIVGEDTLEIRHVIPLHTATDRGGGSGPPPRSRLRSDGELP